MRWPYLLAEGGRLKLANLASLSRLALILPILLLLVAQLRLPALALYLVAVGTDGIDGWLARSEGRASEFGAILDAVVDNVFSVAIALFLWLAFPAVVEAHPLATAALFGVPVLYLGLSWLMTRRVLMFHFTSARLGALLLFAVWPMLQFAGWTWIIPLAALVVSFSRAEQVLFILRGGRDQDARHMLTPVPAPADGPAPSPIDWGAPTAWARGPVVTAPAPDRNAIGVPAGGFAAYRGLALATGQLSPRFAPDYTGTRPAATIGPFPQWSDPSAIVTFDPWGHRVAGDFRADIAAGRDLRPSIAVTAGHLEIAEIRQALTEGRLAPDDRILSASGSISATKIAIEPVWYLPGLAARLGIAEADLRRGLHEAGGGMYPDLVERPDLPLFLPPIGGTSVYLMGDPDRLGDPETQVSVRVHDECNGSDVFGSDLCTCRPYLIEGIEVAIRTAQAGGVGIVIYCRKEGRALGEVVKYLVYNSRRTDPGGDLPERYFAHTEAVAGVTDLRMQTLTMDVLHWLGVRRVATWVSMSNLKSDALRAAGIGLEDQIPLDADRMPARSSVEIDAKKAVGYFAGPCKHG